MRTRPKTALSPLQRCPRLSQLHATVCWHADVPLRFLYAKPRYPGQQDLRGVRLITRRRPMDTGQPAGRRAAQRSARLLSLLLRRMQIEVQDAARRAGRPLPRLDWGALRALIGMAPNGPLSLGQIAAPTKALHRFVRSLGSSAQRCNAVRQPGARPVRAGPARR